MPRLLIMRPARLTVAPFHPGKICLDGGGVRRNGVLRLLEGVAPLLLQGRQLLPADTDLVRHRKLIFVLTQMISLQRAPAKASEREL